MTEFKNVFLFGCSFLITGEIISYSSKISKSLLLCLVDVLEPNLRVVSRKVDVVMMNNFFKINF